MGHPFRVVVSERIVLPGHFSDASIAPAEEGFCLVIRHWVQCPDIYGATKRFR
jgi:hypothetical protein